MATKQDKYTRSAQGQPCQVRVLGICKLVPGNATTVLAHLNGGGMGMKRLSIHGAYACAQCHAWLDGGYTQTLTDLSTRDLQHLDAVIRTQEIMVREGVLIL